MKSAILCRLGSLHSTGLPQAVEDRLQLSAVYRQLHTMQLQGVGGSDLLTASELRALDDALSGYIATMQQRGAPSAEPDEILANLHRLRRSLQPLLPPASGDLVDDPGEEI